MKKTAYFSSERKAQAACKSLMNSGIRDFELIYHYEPDTLRYVTEKNPAGLYLGTGTVEVPNVGLVSGRGLQNGESFVNSFSYSSFLNISIKDEGFMINLEYSPEAEGIIQKHDGTFLEF